MANWHPSWWNQQEHGSAWERVREAVRRDWEQTRHDLHIPGGHELNQKISDTVEQMQGIEKIPANDAPNPPKVIGEFSDVEMPVEYGYEARRKYGTDHPKWNDQLETTLRSEWESPATTSPARRGWNDVRRWVRHGYEYEGKH
jgi:hypothetical protein